ncbi:replication initiation protein RepC [Roseibium sp. H3510]|uniref:Replication initiation protein RepC n=1 Tax=Roseibium algae TaxID=3123038 RepID=A0ABU8TR24_9HYPH
MALEREPCGGRRQSQQPKPQEAKPQEAKLHEGRGGQPKRLETKLDGVSIGLIQSACSTLQEETGLEISTWPALCEAADQLRVLIGLSQPAFNEAIKRQGRYLAAACIAVVTEKALRDPEQISSPGGYFRAMIDRAADGKLHLNKSLHGLVAG